MAQPVYLSLPLGATDGFNHRLQPPRSDAAGRSQAKTRARPQQQKKKHHPPNEGWAGLSVELCWSWSRAVINLLLIGINRMNDHDAKSPCASEFDQFLLFLAVLATLWEAKISFVIARLSKQQVPIPLVATFSKLLFIKIHPTNLNNMVVCKRLVLNSLPSLPKEVLSEELCLLSLCWFPIVSPVMFKPS